MFGAPCVTIQALLQIPKQLGTLAVTLTMPMYNIYQITKGTLFQNFSIKIKISLVNLTDKLLDLGSQFCMFPGLKKMDYEMKLLHQVEQGQSLVQRTTFTDFLPL